MAGANGGDPRGLLGDDCRALVVGTGRHVEGALLADLPSAQRTARALADTLTSACGMAVGQVRLVTDPPSAADILGPLEQAIDEARGGVLVFCFVGHGLLGPGGKLYLATTATPSHDNTVHAVPYAEIENRLADAPVRPVVILDCCFSGLAEAADGGRHQDPYLSVRPHGSFLLASATHYAASFAPEGERYTLFGGELLRLLRDGESGGPRWFTLADVHRHLDRRFEDSPARPHAGSVGRLGDLVLAANPRYTLLTAPDPGPAPPPSDGPCPYPGMRPFLPEQRHLFHGREELTRRLLERVTAADPAVPVVLVGPSGVGKSSLLRAGLGAALDSTDLKPVLLVPAPGALPFRTLSAAWARAVGRPFGEVERDLGAGRFTAPADRRAAPRVLVIDQLEEIFTHCRDTEERRLFARALTGPGDGTGPRVVLGLRADYLGQCLRDPRLARIVSAGQFAVPVMNDDELRAAIEEPARSAGLRWEEGLPDLLLRELAQERVGAGDAIALPFLAHALQETWHRRRGTELTFAGYQASGGIRTSVAQTAEDIHNALDADGRRRLRELLLLMVHLVDTEGRAVRRRVPLEDLDGAGDLLGRLADARLVVVDDGVAQLCHDSLLHGWPRLRNWINTDLDALLVRRRLGQAADAWAEAGRPASGLYAGSHLAGARAVLEDDGHTLGLRPVERDFIAAGEHAERRRRKLTRTGLAIVLTLALLATTLAVLARRAQGDAEARETRLIAEQVARQADEMRKQDPQTALRLSLAAYRTARTPVTRSALYSSYISTVPVDLKNGVEQPVLNVAYRSDGDVLATSQRGGRVQLWDITRPTVPRKGAAVEPGTTAVLAFQPGSRLLAVQTEDRLLLWDTTDPRHPRKKAERRTTGGTTYSLAFSPDGTILASGSDEGRLRLWDMTRADRPRLRHERSVGKDLQLISVAFTRDGRHLLTGNGNPASETSGHAAVRLWDVHDPARPALRDTAAADTVMAVAAHPRRDLAVATGTSGRIVWWRIEDGRRLRRVEPQKQSSFLGEWGIISSDAGIPSLAFRKDGEVLAGADNDDFHPQMLLRKVGAESSLYYDSLVERSERPAGEPVQSVAYSPDGAYIAAGDMGGSVRMWPERPPAPAFPGEPSDTDPGTEAASPDGRYLLGKEQKDGEDYTVTNRVWDVGAATRPRPAFTVPEPWRARYFLPDRKKPPVLVAHSFESGTRKHVFRFWSFDSVGGQPRHGTDIPLTADDVVTAVSPDGTLFAIGAVGTRRLDVWDLSDVHKPVRRSVIDARTDQGHGQPWFLGNRTLVTTEDKEASRDLRLWNLADPRNPRKGATVPGGADGAGLAYLHGSHTLIVEGEGETLRLWDMSDPDKPGKGGVLRGTSQGYYPVTGGRLATLLRDGSVRFWDISDVDHPDRQETLRLDHTVNSIKVTPDGRHVVTGMTLDGQLLDTPSEFRIWDTEPDGRWRSPAQTSLAGVSDMQVLPGNTSQMAVVAEVDSEKWTFLLDLDSEHIYEELCRTQPLSVPESQWSTLFPHLAHRASCG
ncbi:caspase family protein [Streptomyces sp. NPDC052721]|uniref:caspase, EACC1-associated type n=1 Tax=Streptomyces sp. NPDC052721 TaxID=3154955 RepID=UPI003422C91B